jgi:Putative DNA-binding domain
VAALANNVGGAIVIGVEEEDGVATKVTPVALSEDHVLRMQQWLASYTTPRLDAEIRAIPHPGDPQQGIYVVEVPRSLRAPHALIIKGVSLRYYRRSGPRNHPLSEPEIAEAYYSRFSRFRESAERIEALAASSGPQNFAEEHGHTWLAVTLMPAYAGSFEISSRTLRSVEAWAPRACNILNRGSQDRAFASPSMDLISVSTHHDEIQPPSSYYLQLYTDGAASVAAQLAVFPRNPAGADSSGYGLFTDDVVRMGAECLRVAAEHASLNAGTRGEAIAICRLILRRGPVFFGFAAYGDDFRSWEPYKPERGFSPPGAAGKPRSVNIDWVLRDPVEWMLATRRILSDVFHLAGQPEVRQIDEGGALNTGYWQPGLLGGWSAVASVPRVKK